MAENTANLGLHTYVMWLDNKAFQFQLCVIHFEYDFQMKLFSKCLHVFELFPVEFL